MKENTFPVFKPFAIEDFKIYQDFIYNFPQHCDFTLNNLLIWLSGDKGIEYSWINENVVLRIFDSLYLGKVSQPVYTILGDKNADASLEEIFNNENLKIQKLILVPDYFVNTLNSDNYILSEDSSNNDYIVEIDALLQKSGRAYENFRYQISYFLKNYSGDAVLKNMNLLEPTTVTKIVNGLHAWPKINSFVNGNDPMKNDAVAIDRLLRLEHILPDKHQCIGLYINNQLEGFSIFHIPKAKQRIALGNHIKFNGEYERLFDFLVYATASQLKSEGIELLNAEQDMGIEGIRNHKRYLNPKTYYKKYSVQRKG